MAYCDKEGGCHGGVNRLFRDLFPDKNNSSVTEREDAMILRTAVFKLFNAYFGIFFIAFAANRIPDAPWLKCPAWQVCIGYVRNIYMYVCIYVCIHHVDGSQVCVSARVCLYVCVRVYTLSVYNVHSVHVHTDIHACIRTCVCVFGCVFCVCVRVCLPKVSVQ